MFNVVRHLVFFLILFAFLMHPFFGFAQTDPKLQVPETLEGVKQGVLHIGDKIIAAIPGTIAGIWKNEVIPVWKVMWNWAGEEIWQKRVKPALETLVDKGKSLLGKEIEKRKPLIEQGFEQEKQELEVDIQTYGKSAGKGLWGRFLGLFSKE